MGFNEWLTRGYAQVVILPSVVIVTVPLNASAQTPQHGVKKSPINTRTFRQLSGVCGIHSIVIYFKVI